MTFRFPFRSAGLQSRNTGVCAELLRPRARRARAFRLVVWTLAAVGVVSCGGSPNAPTPPAQLRISCPAPIEVVSSAALTVTFPAPTVTGGRQPVTSSCTPASGTEFQRGTTSVLCSAQDGGGATVGCSFDVRVRGEARLSLTSFMAFGDSLTEGTVAPSALRLLTINSQSYPFKLENLLRARYPNQSITVANAGEGGEQATEGAKRFHSTLLSVRPLAVLLMQGSNDLFFWHDDGIARAIPALATMINDAQTHDVEVFLATIPPQRPTGSRATVAAIIPAFNEAVRGLARDRGVILVDVERIVLEDMSLIGNDDLHLTERGYDKVAELFLKVIQETLEIEEGG